MADFLLTDQARDCDDLTLELIAGKLCVKSYPGGLILCMYEGAERYLDACKDLAAAGFKRRATYRDGTEAWVREAAHG